MSRRIRLLSTVVNPRPKDRTTFSGRDSRLGRERSDVGRPSSLLLSHPLLRPLRSDVPRTRKGRPSPVEGTVQGTEVWGAGVLVESETPTEIGTDLRRAWGVWVDSPVKSRPPRSVWVSKHPRAPTLETDPGHPLSNRTREDRERCFSEETPFDTPYETPHFPFN